MDNTPPAEINENRSPNLIRSLITRWRSTILFGTGFLFLGFGGIQLIPIDRTNPPVTCEIKWDLVETKTIAVNACYDCHSNETVWPWYSKIAPVSWRVANHVTEGREHINFSEWDVQYNPDLLIEDFADVLLHNTMPTRDYRWAHGEARLSDDEKQQLIDGFTLSVQQNGNTCAE
jgi:hypothetical protein